MHFSSPLLSHLLLLKFQLKCNIFSSLLVRLAFINIILKNASKWESAYLFLNEHTLGYRKYGIIYQNSVMWLGLKNMDILGHLICWLNNLYHARKHFLLKTHYTVAIFLPFAPKTDIRFSQCFSSTYISVRSFWIKSYLESSKKHIWEIGILNISDCWNWWFEFLLSAIENILAKEVSSTIFLQCSNDILQWDKMWLLEGYKTKFKVLNSSSLLSWCSPDIQYMSIYVSFLELGQQMAGKILFWLWWLGLSTEW